MGWHFGFVRNVRLHMRRLRRAVRPLELGELASHSRLRLHLGCGSEHLKDWINIDADPNSAADAIMDFRDLEGAFAPASVDNILMVHSISYLRLWEARDLLATSYRLLKPGGTFVAEFPDASKCAAVIASDQGDVGAHLEAIRGLYAFDLGQIARREAFTPYAFGWSAWHLRLELEAAGFRSTLAGPPQMHGRLAWRDSRVEATR